MTKKRYKFLIVIGALLILTAGGLKVYDMVQDYMSGRSARLLLEQMRELPASAPPSGDADSTAEVTVDASAEQKEIDSAQFAYDVIGILEIPELNLQLPVLSECTNSLLNVSVCRYMGSAEDKPERLIVAGHSYKSHFGNLTKLSVGDKVLFSSLSGAEYSYSVTAITVIAGNGHAALEQGEWDMTLFTCNFDGSKRVVVRCTEVQA